MAESTDNSASSNVGGKFAHLVLNGNANVESMDQALKQTKEQIRNALNENLGTTLHEQSPSKDATHELTEQTRLKQEHARRLEAKFARQLQNTSCVPKLDDNQLSYFKDVNADLRRPLRSPKYVPQVNVSARRPYTDVRVLLFAGLESIPDEIDALRKCFAEEFGFYALARPSARTDDKDAYIKFQARDAFYNRPEKDVLFIIYYGGPWSSSALAEIKFVCTQLRDVQNTNHHRFDLLLLFDSEKEPPRSDATTNFGQFEAVWRVQGKELAKFGAGQRSDGSVGTDVHAEEAEEHHTSNEFDPEIRIDASAKEPRKPAKSAPADFKAMPWSLDLRFTVELTEQLLRFSNSSREDSTNSSFTLLQLCNNLKRKLGDASVQRFTHPDTLGIRPICPLMSNRQAHHSIEYFPVPVNDTKVPLSAYKGVSVFSIAWKRWKFDDSDVDDGLCRRYLGRAKTDSKVKVKDMSRFRLRETVRVDADQQRDVVDVEHKKLREILTGDYYFDWESCELSYSLNCDRQLRKELQDFIARHGKDPNNLIVVQYSGHGRLEKRSNTVTWQGMDPTYSLEWTPIQTMIQSTASADVLFILDTCHAGGTATERTFAGSHLKSGTSYTGVKKNKIEVIAASGKKSVTDAVGGGTFHRRLNRVLRQLVLEDGVITTDLVSTRVASVTPNDEYLDAVSVDLTLKKSSEDRIHFQPCYEALKRKALEWFGGEPVRSHEILVIVVKHIRGPASQLKEDIWPMVCWRGRPIYDIIESYHQSVDDAPLDAFSLKWGSRIFGIGEAQDVCLCDLAATPETRVLIFEAFVNGKKQYTEYLQSRPDSPIWDFDSPSDSPKKEKSSNGVDAKALESRLRTLEDSHNVTRVKVDSYELRKQCHDLEVARKSSRDDQKKKPSCDDQKKKPKDESVQPAKGNGDAGPEKAGPEKTSAKKSVLGLTWNKAQLIEAISKRTINLSQRVERPVTVLAAVLAALCLLKLGERLGLARLLGSLLPRSMNERIAIISAAFKARGRQQERLRRLVIDR
ncbi:MAG: hypothetical protein M1828_007541 [Chrysothrix sp. TS-e1954]|nr:MAG: hypothetical protein M1828_007541 [Chrysothrix sp. TS-e1954]